MKPPSGERQLNRPGSSRAEVSRPAYRAATRSGGRFVGDGCTRFGSPGIFGYRLRHGAVGSLSRDSDAAQIFRRSQAAVAPAHEPWHV
jgi:hypothetical protein